MLFRVFILIFAFNAIIPSAFAGGMVDSCVMNMDKENVLMMSDSSAKPMCKMMGADNSCYSSQCFASCVINITSLPSSEDVFLVSLSSNEPHVFKPAHFYQVILPILTPPPLV